MQATAQGGQVRNRWKATLAALAVVGAGLGGAVALGRSVGGSAGDLESGAAVYRAGTEALPEGFRESPGGPEAVERLDAVVDRTKVSAFDLPSGRALVITGSHDALETMLPESGLAAVSGEPAVWTGSNGGWTYRALRAADHYVRVAMAHEPGPSFAADVAPLLADPSAVPAVASGDLSALTNGADSATVTYEGPAGQLILVQTYLGEQLDPILGQFEPIATPTTIDDRPAYLLNSGNGNLVVATETADGTLVVIAASDASVGLGALEAIAASLEEV